ncbi:MAG TPA: class I SAM-dependent methyltransferase [Ktedonosporobacter sp.]|nr:class I SAM-dependent methyltransferase [Ktedonosporobacter sp.]
MSTPDNQRREHPSAYFVQDRSNQEEMTRLQIQDHMLTAGMGGVLSEQPDPASFQRVLDVGCGTGGWLIEVAKAYPTIKLLIGVDVSGKMVHYARAQAEAQGVSDRVEFHVMDALRMLEFPNAFFDLVNQRFGVGYLRTWEWPKLLSEYQRVSRPGKVIRITESTLGNESNSPALRRLSDLLLQTLHQAGNAFTPDADGIIGALEPMLRQHGLQNLQTRTHALHYRAGTPEGQHFYEDMRLAFRTLLPFLRRWTRVPDDYEEIYQQALREMQQPDFEVRWKLLTVWGKRGPYIASAMRQ